MTRVVSATTGGVAPSPTEELAWSTWWQGLRGASRSHTRYRYSVSKAHRLLAYTQNTSAWRHLAVLLVFPLPGLLAPLVPTFVVLQDPMLGVVHNPGFFVHGVLTTIATFGGGMMQARAVTSLSHREVSTFEVLAIAVVGVPQFWLVMGTLGIVWRFPVPFTMVLGAAPYTLALVSATVIVLRRHMLRPSHVRSRLLVYLPSHSVQVAQILFYPIYSMLFESTNQIGQILLIALFPICKHYLKRAVSRVSYHLGDFQREVAVAGIDICASIYHATIIQNTPSIVSSVLIILIDIVQGLLEIRLFLSMDTAAFARAWTLLQDSTKHFPDETLVKFASAYVNIWKSLLQMCSFNTRQAAVAAAPPASVVTNAIATKRRLTSGEADADARAVTQTLEVLQSMESMLLSEYLETVAPIVNTGFLLVASQLKSALYNPRVRPFYNDPSALHAAVASVFVYSILQGLTLSIMCLLIRRQYQISALAVLGFVLETHVWSLQGKMIAWFAFMLAFSVVHYGVDFSFKFDFRSQPPN